MKLDRAAVGRHIERVSVGGLLDEAVFTGAFECQAMTPDELLLVIAPPLAGAEDLPSEVGVVDLAKLIRGLRLLAPDGEDAETVEIRLDGGRFIIDEARGEIRLMTAAPRALSTRVEPEVREVLDKKMATVGPGAPLPVDLVESIKATHALLKSEEVEVFLGPAGGRIRVGHETSHVAEFESEELLTADDEYSLLFGVHLVEVLKIATSEAHIRFGGPEVPVVIVEDEGFVYVLSSMSRGTDG